MPIRKVGTPEFGGQALANAGALERQALATESQFQNFMNQLPLETANKFIGLLEAARARRAQKSAASKARKESRLKMGIATGAGAVAGGALGGLGLLAPAVGTGIAGGASGVALGGLLGGAVGAGVGSVGSAFSAVPSTFAAFQPQTTPTTLTGSLGNFTLPTGQTGGATPVAPVGQAGRISGDIQSGASPFDLGTLSVPAFSPGQVQKSATERAITGEEPTAGITITPKDIEQSAQNLKKIGQQAIDEGDAETALQLAKILADLEFRGAA